jgi:hypothetical protein
MNARDLVLPAAVLIGGAVLGRVFGFKPIWRGAMAVLALAEAGKGVGLIEAEPAAHHKRAPRRKTVTRAVRKRTAQKKSPKVAHAAS